jgi:tungstate transport system permease protein
VLLGVPIGVVVGASRFPGRRAAIVLLNTLMAVPTVLIGLLGYALLCHRGPLGGAGMLFTPSALVFGQVLLATPVLAAFTVAGVSGCDPRLLETARSLGAGRLQSAWLLVREARFAVMAAVVAGFGRVISEVGAATILGGNIKGYTRTVTTAITLEVSKGEFGLAVALGVVLMCVALSMNLIFQYLQGRGA